MRNKNMRKIIKKRIVFIILLICLLCCLFAINKQYRRPLKKEYTISKDDPFLLPAEGTITAIDKDGSHKGSKAVDIANSKKTPIHSAMDGTVIFSDHYGQYGKCVIIVHKDNYSTLYAHLEKSLVVEDQRVDKGAVIGEMGNTGNSTGVHLHFEIRKRERRENILKYFPFLEVGMTVRYE